MSETVAQTRIKRRVLAPIKEEDIPKIRKRKRIPVDEIYWEKGTYKELVDDPFNLKK